LQPRSQRAKLISRFPEILLGPLALCDFGAHLVVTRERTRCAARREFQELLGLSQTSARSRFSVVSRVSFGETQKISVRVAEGGDDHVGPESGSILADAPALVARLALAGGTARISRGLLFI